jgi:hypothetical protein
MPRASVTAWKSDPIRAEYYRQRAIRAHRELEEHRAKYIDRKTLERELKSFCVILKNRITQSKLDANLKSELCDDIRDYVQKVNNGPNGNGQKPTSNRGRAKRRKG